MTDLNADVALLKSDLIEAALYFDDMYISGRLRLAADVIHAIIDLHHSDEFDPPMCVGCDDIEATIVTWPCPTIIAIAKALGTEP
ncbi:MAG TPA: hypothetical protein VIV12_06275 [Streptosporangiaceae bacterium]